MRLGILTKVDFLLLFQESTHPLVAYLNRFCSSTQMNWNEHHRIFQLRYLNGKPVFSKIFTLGTALKNLPFWGPKTPFTCGQEAIKQRKNLRFQKYPDTCRWALSLCLFLFQMCLLSSRWHFHWIWVTYFWSPGNEGSGWQYVSLMSSTWFSLGDCKTFLVLVLLSERLG